MCRRLGQCMDTRVPPFAKNAEGRPQMKETTPPPARTDWRRPASSLAPTHPKAAPKPYTGNAACCRRRAKSVNNFTVIQH